MIFDFQFKFHYCAVVGWAKHVMISHLIVNWEVISFKLLYFLFYPTYFIFKSQNHFHHPQTTYLGLQTNFNINFSSVTVVVMTARPSIKGCFASLLLKIYEFENCARNRWLCVVTSLYYVYSIYRINVYVLHRKCMIMWSFILTLSGVWVHSWPFNPWHCGDGDPNTQRENKAFDQKNNNWLHVSSKVQCTFIGFKRIIKFLCHYWMSKLYLI